jgi:hypothetical protein
MNKTVVIIGSIALLGVGAYFYFKPKAKDTSATGLGGEVLSNSEVLPTTSVPPTGTVLETPAQVAETAQKIAEARVLVSKITELRKERSILLSKPLSYFGVGTSSLFGTNNTVVTTIKNTQVAGIDKKIRELEISLSKLGYTEANGNLVKIV